MCCSLEENNVPLKHKVAFRPANSASQLQSSDFEVTMHSSTIIESSVFERQSHDRWQTAPSCCMYEVGCAIYYAFNSTSLEVGDSDYY